MEESGNEAPQNEPVPAGANAGRPSAAQLRYLRLGLTAAGGKLPLFGPDGQEISAKTIRACIGNGWAQPWFANPLKPEWLVCRLTEEGRVVAAIGQERSNSK
jgi:hypothetical protein